MKNTKNSKEIKIIYISLFIIFSIFFVNLFIIINNQKRDSSKTVIITKLNEEYSGKIKVVATDIKTIKVPENKFLDDNDDNEEVYYVGVKFEVCNNSNKTLGVNGTQLTTYVDDVLQSSVDFAKEYFDNNNEHLFSGLGDLAPGKKTVGYEVARVQENSKTVEFHFDYSDYGNIIIFKFDIPPVTE